MAKNPFDEFDSKPSAGTNPFDEFDEPKKRGAIDTAVDYGAAVSSALGQAAMGVQAAAGQFVQAPGANAMAVFDGAAAGLNRGAVAAANWIAPGSAELNADVQATAQQSSRAAADQRLRNARIDDESALAWLNPRTAISRFGLGLQEDARARNAEILANDRANNPELVRQQQAVSDADGFIPTVKAMAQNPMATTHTMVRSLPDMVGGLAVARHVAIGTMAKAGTLADAAAAKVAAAGGDIAAQAAAAKEAVDMVGKVAVARASTAGMLSEAASTAYTSREGVFQEVMNLPPEKLAASPRYLQVLKETGGDADKAREILANELADQAPVLAAAGTLAGSRLTRRIFGGDTTAKAVAGVERTTLKDVGKNILEEGTEEALQGVPEDLAQHGATSQADPSKKFDLGGSVAQNMMAGALMGGGGTGARFAQQRFQGAQIAAPVEDSAGSPASATQAPATQPEAATATPAPLDAGIHSDANPAPTGGSPIAPGQALPPEARLAQLDILAETRDLTPTEKAEATQLTAAVSESDAEAGGGAVGTGTGDAAMGVRNFAETPADPDAGGLLRLQETPAGAAPRNGVSSEAATAGVTPSDAGPRGLLRIEHTPAGTKPNSTWRVFPPESGTLGIPRADMPQIRADHRGAMVNFLNARGIPHEQVDVPADSLKPTQAEFSPAKVKKAAAYTGGERSILVSSDGYVVDGHHQWLAKLQTGEPIKAIRLDAPIRDLLPVVREFPSASTAKGAVPPTQAQAGRGDFWSFAREQGFAPADLKVGSDQWAALQEQFKARASAGQGAPSGNPAPAAPSATQSAAPSAPAAASTTDTALQNRDRSRVASVTQMGEIMRSPDYGRLGPSRTPESGAPMVFAVGDDTRRIPAENFGRDDVATMADGQRVPFRYAVVNANEVQPSNLVDGRVNAAYASNEPGTLKALNNGRTAGVRAAHAIGTTEQYTAELKGDAFNHGILPAVIDGTPNPLLVRVYSERGNTHDMAAKSQGSALGMSPSELARQDAPLLDASVLSEFKSGEITSAANRDFVRAFVGKLRQSGQDTSMMMTQDGSLSQAGRQRLQAALMQAAYGDAELVQELFDSVDTDIKAIGEALKTVSGEWASMRDSALMGAIDPATDITGNVMGAVNLIRRSRREGKGLYDLVHQTDLLSGEAIDPLTTGALRLFYSGEYFTRAIGKERTAAMLRDFVAGAMTTSPGVDLLGDSADPMRVLAAIIHTPNDQGATNAHTPPTQGSREPSGHSDPVGGADEARQAELASGSRDADGRIRLGQAGEGDRQADGRALREGGRPNQEGAGPASAAAGTEGVAPGSAASDARTTIEDAGEKIGGARKDWRDRGLAVADLDAMTESEGATLVSKANVWKPDYAALARDVGEPVTVALVKVIYDSLAAKPKIDTPQGRRDYVRAMQAVREVYSAVRSLDEVNLAWKKLRAALGVDDHRGMSASAEQKAARQVMFSVYKGRSDPFVLGITELQRARKLVLDGFPGAIEPWTRRFAISRSGGAGSTPNGVAAIVKQGDALGTPVTAEQAKAGVFLVIGKTGRKAVAMAASREDAEAAARAVYERERGADGPSRADPERPHLDKLTRENLKQAIDRDVKPEDLLETFGFRGVEFGNWAAQDERQKILNLAYDAMADLATILNVPPRALSLNGTMGLAFGARGGGRFAAHYEPGKLVINMTKLRGAGSLSHEWAHAFDHYLGELDRTDAYQGQARGASGWTHEERYSGTPEKRMVKDAAGKWTHVESMRLGNLRPELAAKVDAVMRRLYNTPIPQDEAISIQKAEIARTEAYLATEKDPKVRAAYEDGLKQRRAVLVDLEAGKPSERMKRSSFATEAQKLSGKSATGYWLRPTEMFARAFESYTFDRLKAMGASSDYLVHGVESERFADGTRYKGNPYPTGDERAAINAAFDDLAHELQAVEGEGGNVVLRDLSRVGARIGKMGYEKQDTPRIQAARKLAGLIKRLDQSEISPLQFEVSVRALAEDMDQVVTTKAANRLMTDRARGADIVREKLIRARRQGDLEHEAVEFALWALDQNPSLADNLGISVRAPNEDGGAAGDYNPAAEIIRLFKGSENPDTTVHEIMHHAERMMPVDLQDAIRREWAASLAAAIKNATPEQVVALEHIPAALAGSKVAYKALIEAIQNGPLNYAEHYQLVNPSEFWAVNAARLMGRKFEARSSVWQRARTWVSGMVAKVRGLLGLRSDGPVLKALGYLTDLDNFGPERGGRFESDSMLSDPRAVAAAGGHFANLAGSSSPGPQSAWEKVKARVMALTSPASIDNLIYETQDKLIDLKRLREHIQAIGGTITDLNDAYLGEELFHKRLAKRTEDFLANELKPLLADLRARGITTAAFETYLHARHAKEANAAMAERNPNQQMLDDLRGQARKTVQTLAASLEHARLVGSATKAIEASLGMARDEANRLNMAQAFKGTEAERLSLSGMTDDEARALIDSQTPAKQAHLDALAARVDAMNAKTLELLERYGLMDKASIAAWRQAYQFYVPLHRDEAHVDNHSHPIGSGFSVKGDAARQRVGSNQKVTHILGHIAMQREAALTRGEKNHVVKRLYLMAAQNPDPKFWSLDKLPITKTVDPVTGFVRTGVDPRYKTMVNVVMLRVAGKDVAITFNEHNPNAVRLAEAMKNLDVGDLHVILGLASKATRWFAAVNTQYNPIFGVMNFARDLQEAALNLSTTPIAGKNREVASNVLKAMRAIYRAERGKTATDVEWTRLWHEMQDVGGTTGYRDLYADVAERTKALERELTALDRGQVSKAAHAVVDWLSHYNESMENSVRLSAYKVALDQGLSKERAASLAKNLTVNFNRKGRQSREIGAGYAFFNASMQGSARMFETLRGPIGKRIMYGGVALGAINTLIGMAMMGGGADGEDDEWEKVPEFIKERSIIIPLSHQDYVSIPMPLGFKVFPNIGRLAVEFAFGGSEKTAGRQLGKMLMTLTDAFNPLGGAQDLAQMIAPTVIDPLVALMKNLDWTGQPIYRENTNPLDPHPGHTMAKDSASTLGRGLARAINAVTGGTEYRPGAWSPTPDQIDYVIGQLTGGLGRELLKLNQTLAAPFTGDELPAHKIPLVGRLYGNTRGTAGQSGRFYENVKELNELENELKGRNRNGEDAEAFRKAEPLTNVIGAGNTAEAAVHRLRTQRRHIVEAGEADSKERIREIDTRIAEVMGQLNATVSKARKEAAAAN